MLRLLIVVTLALAVSAESEADAYHVYGSPAYPSYYSGVSPYYNQYKPAAYYNSHYYGASPYAYRYRRDAEAEPEADSQVYMTSPYVASPYVATHQYSAATPYVYANQYPASTYAATYPAATYPAATYASAYPQPAMTYAQPKIATTAGVVATPYAANPFFFNMGGGGIWGNNFGGKASYGGSQQKQGYPTANGHDDHYHGHFHINDGWGLYDEDLRDRDTPKSDKFGSNKDGGK
jgi:hypothetical protein